MKRNFIAEFVGTFALVFVGSGAIIIVQQTGNTAGLLQVALAHGLILAIMVSAFMNVSGGHFNPAVTLAFAAVGRIPAAQIPVYWASQLAGGLIAIGLLEALKKA